MNITPHIVSMTIGVTCWLWQLPEGRLRELAKKAGVKLEFSRKWHIYPRREVNAKVTGEYGKVDNFLTTFGKTEI